MAKHDAADASAHNPHDGLIKRIFTQPEAARAELQAMLPGSLTRRLDWDSLTVEPSSFVDPELRTRTSDILYSIRVHGATQPVSVYIVMEHQSSPDPLMAARFFIYVARLYERHMRRHERAKWIPLVLPMLMYQGPTGWTKACRLSELIRPSVEQVASPIELEFLVDDLHESLLSQQVDRDQLARDRGTALAEMARTLLWLYHHPDASDGQRATLLSELRTVIEQAWGAAAVEPFFVYFLSVFESGSPIRGTMLKAAPTETKQLYTTIRDELIAEGKARGLAEGKARGLAEGEARGLAVGEARGLSQMLERLIEGRGLELRPEQRTAIGRCSDTDQLRRWFDRAMTASSADEVFES